MRLLILCPDPVGDRMSGMGIRYSEIARALAGEGIEVVLAGREVDGAAPVGVRCTTWAADRVGPVRDLLRSADVVFSPPLAPHVMRAARRSGARVAVDLYDPESFEVLERFRSAPRRIRQLHSTTATDRLVDALRGGQFFVCASERQRDLWIGAMLALGLLTPAVYDGDATLRRTIDLLPFGVPAEPPPPSADDPIRSRFPSIGPDERILLWNGGLWGWLDAPLAIRALTRVRADGVPARLVFMGASRAGGAAEALAAAHATVRAEGLHEDAVLFNDQWVDYRSRDGWLAHADVAVATHQEHLETRFAFRTRLLDCFWAGLPPVVSTGDTLAEEIAAHDLGAVAAPGDLDALAAGIGEVLAKGKAAYADGLRAAADRHTWPRVVEPLRRFVLDGERRPDPLGSRNPLVVAPAVHARRAAQRVTRLARALRG
jgi:glycosyltransferase involved in cell wall biosynthesis